MEFHKLKACLDTLVSEEKVPGVDCIVYQNHEIVFRYFTGMSDLEEQKKMQGDELYLIFSMTKMLTCVSALQLWERGKYSLDDQVSKYLPEFDKMRISDLGIDVEASAKVASGAGMGAETIVRDSGYAKTPITIRHLFSMSAGLDYDLNSAAITEAKKQGKKTTRELVTAISETILGFEPGTRYRYSLCHDVLGALIEVWSGQKLGEYMKEHIFEPLGMTNIFFGLPKEQDKLSRMAARYTHGENRLPKRLDLECVYNLTEEYQSGGAGLTSCAEDYALFLDAMACGGVGRSGARIISSETIALMKINQLSETQLKDFLNRPGYGYGLGVRTHMNAQKSGCLSPIGEFGWDGAAGAFAMVDTENQISLTYFQHIHNWDIKKQTMLRNALYSQYHFYGWASANCKAVTNIYKGVNTPRDLYDYLSDIWCADTCAPRMRADWTKENMTLGQCSITAFLVQDIFGGEVRGILLPGGNYHCFNVVGEAEFDLTSEQFGDVKLDYSVYQPQTRESHFSKQEKYERYLFLKNKLLEYCK